MTTPSKSPRFSHSNLLLALALVLFAIALTAGSGVSIAADQGEAGTKQKDEFVRWEPEIQKFEQQDKQSPPKPGGVLFIGSSSIKRWDLEKSYTGRGYLNRGFGGSQIADSTHFADRILLPARPRLVVLYAGDNDLARGKSPEQVAADFAAFAAKVHGELPKTRIAFIGIKPSLARWKIVDKVRDANRRIAAQCEKNELLDFIDIDKPMIGEDGKPRKELFASDGLHLSPEGYELWVRLLAPHLGKSELRSGATGRLARASWAVAYLLRLG